MSNSYSHRLYRFGYRTADLRDGAAARESLEARYRPVAIPAVAAALEAMRRSKPAPEAMARIWAGREFD